jgi:hypothetical protein
MIWNDLIIPDSDGLFPKTLPEPGHILFLGYISALYHGQKSDIISYPLSRQKKDMILYPILFNFILENEPIICIGIWQYRLVSCQLFNIEGATCPRTYMVYIS